MVGYTLLPPVPFKPLPGYKAMLRLDGQWITAHFRECVKFAHTSPALIAYIIRRLEISPATFELIDWRSIGRVRSTHGFSLKVRISKMMYLWLVVGHNWRKCNLTTDWTTLLQILGVNHPESMQSSVPYGTTYVAPFGSNETISSTHETIILLTQRWQIFLTVS